MTTTTTRWELPRLSSFEQGNLNACVPCALVQHLNMWKAVQEKYIRIHPVSGKVMVRQLSQFRPLSAAYLYVLLYQKQKKESQLEGQRVTSNPLTNIFTAFDIIKSVGCTYDDVYSFSELHRGLDPEILQGDDQKKRLVKMQRLHRFCPSGLLQKTITTFEQFRKDLHQYYGMIVVLPSSSRSEPNHFVYIPGYRRQQGSQWLIIIEDSQCGDRYEMPWEDFVRQVRRGYVLYDRFL